MRWLAGVGSRRASWAKALDRPEHRVGSPRPPRAVLRRAGARHDHERGRHRPHLVLEDKDLAPKTIRNVVATLSALCNFAMGPRRRWATTNPCHGVDLPAV